MGLRESSVIRCPQHLQWVRGHVCAVAGKLGLSPNGLNAHVHFCEGKIEAAHVRRGGNGGTSMKPDDSRTIPLCHEAHAQQHQIGEAAFERAYVISMADIAAELWRISPAGSKYRRDHDTIGREGE